MTIIDLANRTIQQPHNLKVLVKANFDTMDIVKEILSLDTTCAADVALFAKSIQSKSEYDFCKTIHDFVLFNIRYVEDPIGFQFTKTPSATWKDRFADCKSMSIFNAQMLKNKGIKFSYRFASYSSVPKYTHVYIVAHTNQGDVIIDPVLESNAKVKTGQKFNQEKKYTFKQDHTMTGIFRVSGIGATTAEGRFAAKKLANAKNPRTVLDFHKPIDEMTEADMDAAIILNRLEIERDIIAKKRGIGSVTNGYDRSIKVMRKFVGAMATDDLAEMERLADSTVEGIGKITFKKLIKKLAPKNVIKSAVKTVKKVVKTAVKVTKAVTKVATAPLRLATKATLEVILPKAAPFFLYLFITKPEIIAKCPAKVQRKRKKQAAFANFIVNVIGMKREHFMGIVRNGLMKRHGMSPEAYLSKLMKMQVSGIGLIDDVIKVVLELVGMISKMFKKKPGPGEEPSADDAPSDDDFAEMNAGEIKEMTQQTLAQRSQTDANVDEGSSSDSGSSDSSDQIIPDDGGGTKVRGICG
jgi:histone H3/H4